MFNDVSMIAVSDIKELTSISNNISPEFLEPYILIGEEFHVYDILGTALTNEIKNQITGNSLTELNQVLLKNFITPLAAYSAWFEAAPFINFKTTEKGIVKQHSNNSENVSETEFSFYRQAIKDKVSFLQTRLDTYLEDNKDSYPLFRPYKENSSDGNSTGIYLGSE